MPLSEKQIFVRALSNKEFSGKDDTSWVFSKQELDGYDFIALDVSQVTKIHSRGMGRLVRLHHKMQFNMTDIAIISPSDEFLSLFRTLHIASKVHQAATKNELVEKINMQPKRLLMISVDRNSAGLVRDMVKSLDATFSYRHPSVQDATIVKEMQPSMLIVDLPFVMEHREALKTTFGHSYHIPVLVLMPPSSEAREFKDTFRSCRVQALGMPFPPRHIHDILSSNFRVMTKDAKPKLLAVDDLNFMRQVLKSNLEEDYEVFLAENGEEAIEVAEHEKPDIILMDVEMPVMDGLTATRKIKSNPDLKHIPVLVLTAKAAVDIIETACKAGAADYILKPPDFTIIREKIAKYIKK
ncbi:MAG: response regulator [Proteobacteria bacterium]|nr:response regulator [Pseudomonadota bacterium]